MAGGGPVEPVGPAAPAGSTDPRVGARREPAADARSPVAGAAASGGDAAAVLRRVVAAPLGGPLWQLADGERLLVSGADARLRPGALLRIVADTTGRLSLVAIGPNPLARPVEVQLLPRPPGVPDDAVELRQGHPVEIAWPDGAERPELPRRAVLQLGAAAGRDAPSRPDQVAARATVLAVDPRGTLVDVMLASEPRRALLPGVRLPVGETVTLSWSAAATVGAGSRAEASAEAGEAPIGRRAADPAAGGDTRGPGGPSPPAPRGVDNARPAGTLGRPGGAAAAGTAVPDPAPRPGAEGGGGPRGATGVAPAPPAPSAAIGTSGDGAAATGSPSRAGSTFAAAGTGPPRPGAVPSGRPAATGADEPGGLPRPTVPAASAPPAAGLAARTGAASGGTLAVGAAGLTDSAAAAGADRADPTVEPGSAAGAAASRAVGDGGARGGAAIPAPAPAVPPLPREPAPDTAVTVERRDLPAAVSRDADPAAGGRGEPAATPRLVAEPGAPAVPPPPPTPERPPDSADDDPPTPGDGRTGAAPARRARFHLRLASLGAVDLAASCPDGRLDLVLRVDRRLPEPVRREIEAIHAAALTASGRTGRLTLVDGVGAAGSAEPDHKDHVLDTLA